MVNSFAAGKSGQDRISPSNAAVMLITEKVAAVHVWIGYNPAKYWEEPDDL
jgi:hypothetical protein